MSVNARQYKKRGNTKIDRSKTARYQNELYGSRRKKRSLGKPGISLRDLAAVAHVKHTQISAIEKGKSNATILTLIAIADVLDVDLCELLNYKTKKKEDKINEIIFVWVTKLAS